MNDKPFPSKADSQASFSNRRRSTRINFTTPVFISGRDAGGQPYRELTQTVIVNLHGCKLRTSYRVLVGMQLTLECPKAGTACKAVCVRAWDPPAGVAGHEIAMQLVKPQNLWGVLNPPPDWEIVTKNMIQGRPGQGEPPARVPPPAAAPPAAVPSRPLPPPSTAPAQPPPIAAPSIEKKLAELEHRSQKLVESVLEILRTQAEELTRASMEVFRQQVEAVLVDAEQHLRQGLQRKYEESASALIGLRTDLMEQMSSRGAQLIRSTEESLRARFREILGTQAKAAVVAKPADPPPNK